MGRVVDDVTELVTGHARRVSGSSEGTAAEAFTSTARRVHGEAGLLESLAARCERLAQYCEHGADAIVKARWQCLPSAVFVMALMIYGELLGGWAEAAVLPLIRLEGLALQIALRMIRAAALGLAYSAGLDGIGQLFRWEGFDPGELFGALWQGAFVGGLMGFAHAGLPALAGRGPALTWLAHAMESPGAGGIATRFVVGGSVGTTAMATASAVSGHGWDLEHAAETGFGIAFIGTGTEILHKGTELAGGLRSRSTAQPVPGDGLGAQEGESQEAAGTVAASTSSGAEEAPDVTAPVLASRREHEQEKSVQYRVDPAEHALYAKYRPEFIDSGGNNIVYRITDPESGEQTLA